MPKPGGKDLKIAVWVILMASAVIITYYAGLSITRKNENTLEFSLPVAFLLLFLLTIILWRFNDRLQKQAHDKITRLYVFTSQINQMILRTVDEPTLYREACQIAVSIGKFRMAWVAIVEQDTGKVSRAAHAGAEMDYLSKIKIITPPDGPSGRGPTGRALKEGKYIVCNDIANDPGMAPWKEAALERGYLSSISLPLFKSGKVIGAFSLYAGVKYFFDEAEILLLVELAGDISFALEVFEKEKLRKMAEEAVAQSEQRYHTLAEISPVGIFHTDAEGNTTYVNPRWSEISGLPAAAALGNGWLTAVHPDDRALLINGWQEAIQANGHSHSEYRFVHPDGHTAWVIGQAVPGRDLAGRITGYVGTITDITARKKNETALRKEKYLSDSIINSLPGAFYLYTREGHFLRWNTNFEKETGYNAAEIRQMHPLDFFDTDEKEMIAQKINEVFTTGQSNAEAHFFLKTKQKIPYFFTGKSLEYEGALCLMGVGIDISDKVLAQEKLKETSQQLRMLAAHLQDIREEERASMAREIHDELGQQLTGIKMDVYWLKEELDPSDDGIRGQVDAILGLIDQTITMVRKISAALRPPMLDDLGLEEALRSYSQEFQQRYGILVNGEIQLKNIPLSPKMSIGLYRIFQETLTNVARHADASKVSFKLCCPGDDLVLEIKDNGKGFDTEKIAQKKTLGLLGMRERILMLDGKVDIHSRPGIGTEVIVTMPLNRFLLDSLKPLSHDSNTGRR